MPNFYFGVWDGHRIDPDEDGFPMQGVGDAFEASVAMARDMLKEGMLKGENRSGWVLHVCDERGARVFTLPFSIATVDPHYRGVRVPRRRTT
jgi:hypothetical protein